MSDDFCLIHGYEHMKTQFGNPIPYCEACENDRGLISTTEKQAAACHCGKDGHALGSVNCPVHGYTVVPTVAQSTRGHYGCSLPPGACGCPQDQRGRCPNSHWVESSASPALNQSAPPSLSASVEVEPLVTAHGGADTGDNAAPWGNSPREIQKRAMKARTAAQQQQPPQCTSAANVAVLPMPQVEIDETSPIVDLVWRSDGESFSIVISQSKLVGIHCTVEPPRSSVAWTLPLPDGLLSIKPEAFTGAQPQAVPGWVKILADNWRGRNGNTVTGDSVRNSCADELEKVAARHNGQPNSHGGGK